MINADQIRRELPLTQGENRTAVQLGGSDGGAMLFHWHTICQLRCSLLRGREGSCSCPRKCSRGRDHPEDFPATADPSGALVISATLRSASVHTEQPDRSGDRRRSVRGTDRRAAPTAVSKRAAHHGRHGQPRRRRPVGSRTDAVLGSVGDGKAPPLKFPAKLSRGIEHHDNRCDPSRACKKSRHPDAVECFVGKPTGAGRNPSESARTPSGLR